MSQRPEWDDQFAETEDERQERWARRRAAKAIADDETTLFAELRNLTQFWNAHEDVPKSQQIECRKIGERINAKGGQALMVKAYYDAKSANRHVAVIQAYWNGVGDWVW